MSDKPLKILIVASWYPDAKQPTSGSFVEEQALMLQKAGHTVCVLHPYLMGTFFSSLFKKNQISKELYNTIPVIRVGIKPPLPKQRKLAYKQLFQKCWSALEKYKCLISEFDIIHSHAMFMGAYVAASLAKKSEKEFFHTEHTSGLIFEPEQYNQTDRSIIQTVFNTAKSTFFVSHFALEKTLQQFSITRNERHHVVPNLVADSFFETHEKAILDKPFRYLIICNLIPLKRVDLLLHAWVLLIKEIPDSRLTIAGEGPEKNRLLELTKTLEIEKTVCFLPRLKRSEVKEQIEKHHVLVSTSELETFGLTVAEAQALGKPVVVTDSGGVRDIVEQTTGIICAPEKDSLARGLIDVYKNYGAYSSNHIRKKTHAKFSSSVVYKKLHGFYTQS
jgi:L-malate glycosyltransferase